MPALEHLSDACFLYRGDEAENAFSGFLREFNLAKIPQHAEIAITADTHYKLYVNGRFVNYGPAPFRIPLMRVDTYDLRGYLKTGANEVFVLTRFLGMDAKYNIKERPGLIAALLLDDERILTDSEWKAFDLDAWERDAPRITWALPPMESVDLGATSYACLARYASEDFSIESSLTPDCEVPLKLRRPDGYIFEPRRVPPLRWEKPRTPRLRQVFRTNNEVYNLQDTPLRLEREQVVPAWDIEANEVFKDPRPVLSRAHGEPGYALLFDTLRMTAGDFTIELVASGPATVEIGSAERLIDGRPFMSRNGSYYVTRLKIVAGKNRFRLYALTGFRYLYVLAKDFEGTLKLNELAYHECCGDLDYIDAFKVHERGMEAIYEISKRSIQLTVQGAYHDCNTREHGNYWGDGLWATDMIGHMTGDFSHMREMCLAISSEYASLGTLNGNLYGIGQPLLDYCMIAVEMLRRYAWYTADRETVLKQLPACKALIEDFARAGDHDGFVRLATLKAIKPEAYGDAVLFLDHPGTGWQPRVTEGISREEPNAGLNLYYLLALQAMLDLLQWLGQETKGVKEASAALKPKIKQRFFHPQTGLIADAIATDGTPAGYSQIVNALAVITGVLEGNEGCHAMRTVCDIEQHPWVSQGTPYTYFSLVEALGRLGLSDLGYREIRSCWMPMIEQGATTTWETFRMEFHDSLNHAWSAVLPYFSRRRLAGIEPLVPGYANVRITPALSFLPDAEITAVLPQGPIRVAWQRCSDAKVEVRVTLPEGVEGVLSASGSDQRMVPGLNKMRVATEPG